MQRALQTTGHQGAHPLAGPLLVPEFLLSGFAILAMLLDSAMAELKTFGDVWPEPQAQASWRPPEKQFGLKAG